MAEASGCVIAISRNGFTRGAMLMHQKSGILQPVL